MNYKDSLIYSLFLTKSILQNPLNLHRPILYLFYKLTGQDIIAYKPPMIKGYEFKLDLNSHMDKGIFFSGLLGKPIEVNLFTFLSKYLKKDSIFFDIGANSGYFSILASSIARNGFVHSFEPVLRTHKIFSKTIKLNGIKNIKLNNVCLGMENKIVKFYVDRSSDVSSLRKTPYQKASKPTRSRMIRLADYCRGENIDRIDIIKIDVEGGEKDILFDSKKILLKYKPILIVEFSSETSKTFGFNPNELFDFLNAIGYKIYSYKNNRLRIRQRQSYYRTQDLYCLIN